MLKTWIYRDLTERDLKHICQRPRFETKNLDTVVGDIIQQVKDNGDQAVLKYTETFDGVRPDPLLWKVRSPEEIPVSSAVREAYQTAFENIYAFHKAQIPQHIEVQTMPGIICRREARPIERVGLYIPGGTAPLPSTVLMLGVPSLLAGCSYRILATPPDKNGQPLPAIELAASLTNIEHIYLSGGAQAIAAMALGTETIEKTDKIFGPGNQYVTAAKMALQNSNALISTDLPAGPSEVMVIADSESDPAFVASDLLSQAEHGNDSPVILVSIGDQDLTLVFDALKVQLEQLPRAEYIREAFKHSHVVQVDDTGQAIEMINAYAPEHLIIHPDHSDEFIPHIQHAGSVFLGPWTPESAGDYASGTNHTLPTYGYARMYSGVSVEDFMKFITFQKLTPEGLTSLAPVVTTMAETESLEAHKRAVTIRMERLTSS
ncbi:histidinol dehydrogenase [Balneolaceae bacterium ANBcel3]|nr:histidinol dehydrogenase [Balneolaceae bacterium ANBcel3]